MQTITTIGFDIAKSVFQVLAKVRYAIISGRQAAVGLSFNPVAASLRVGQQFF
jgi:hypothetical protein